MKKEQNSNEERTTSPWRTDIKGRYYRTYAYLTVDRVPDLEFGYWPQTIRRWLKEGLPLSLSDEEQNQVFLPKLDEFFGFEHEDYTLPLNVTIHPAFQEQVIEHKVNSVVTIDSSGTIAERFTNDMDNSSIPHYLKFPVETPLDWSNLKQRFKIDDPVRAISSKTLADARHEAAGKMLHVFFIGFYAQLRNWMGTENLSMAFYDYPGMLQEMVEHWAELCATRLEQVPKDIPIDIVGWHEDMACRNGPLCSPEQFREFLQPGYRRVMDVARQHGCRLSWVDCDGNPYALIPHWLDVGVNAVSPIEMEAGCDPYRWRREFGRELRLRGGISKQPLVDGGTAIDQELERIRPLFEQGGYIPHLDHAVPPNVPYRNYCKYLEKKRKMIGK